MNKINRLAMIRASFNRLADVTGVLPISAVEIKEETAKISRGTQGLTFARGNRRNDTEMENAEGIKSQLRFDEPNVPTERETEILLSIGERRQLAKETLRKVISIRFVSNPVEMANDETGEIFPANDEAEFVPAYSREHEEFARAAIAFEMDCESLPLRLMA